MLLFLDPCDDLTVPADILANGWNGTVGTGTNTFNVGNVGSSASTIGRCMASTGSTSSSAVTLASDLQVPGMKVSSVKTRMSLWHKGSSFGNSTRGLFGWYEDGFLWCITMETNGSLTTYSGPSDTGTEIKVSGSATDNLWHHWEIERLSHPTAGTMRIWRDGVLVVDFTGRTTYSTGANYTGALGAIRLSSAGSGTHSFDDVMVWNDTDNGDGFTGYMGVSFLDTLRPTADGDTSQLVPSSGTTHYSLVNDSSPSADTSYLAATTVGQRDFLQLADLPVATDQIKALAVRTQLVSQSVGPGKVRASVKSAGVVADGPDIQVETLNPIVRSTGFGKDPATNAAWTSAGVNALQAGLFKTN